MFDNCPDLKIVWVEEGLTLDVKRYVADDVVVLPAKMVVGDQLLRDLRGQKDVAIPDGVERIGERWFVNSKVESVTVPASVTAIEKEAFCDCKCLRRVIFALGSKLKKIGSKGFCRTGIEKVVLPKSLAEIRESAFEDCESLKEAVFEEGSKLDRIGARCFSGSGLEELVLPASLREVGADAFNECK